MNSMRSATEMKLAAALNADKMRKPAPDPYERWSDSTGILDAVQ